MEERATTARETSTQSQQTGTGQQVREQAAQQGRRVGETIKEEGRELTDEARDRIGHVFEESKQQVRHEAEKQMGTAGRTLREAGTQMERMAEQADGFVATMTRSLGSEVRRFGERVDQRGLDGMMDDVTRFARERPGAFLAGSAALGFLAGRLIKNAGSSDGRSRQGTQGMRSGMTEGARTTATPTTGTGTPGTEYQTGYRGVGTQAGQSVTEERRVGS